MSYGDIGKASKDLLGGYQYGTKLTTSPSIEGILDFKVTHAFKGDTVGHDVKITAPKCALGKLEGTVNDKGVPGLTITRDKGLAGLKISIGGNPSNLASLSATLEYAKAPVSAKLVSTLTAKPKIELTGAAKVRDVLVGGTAAFDTAKGSLTKYAFGAGVASKDHSLALFAEDQLGLIRVAGSHNLGSVAVAAEASFKVADGAFGAAAGAQWTSGALKCKGKVDAAGTIDMMAETKVQSHSLAVCGQFNALRGSDPKIGLALDLKP